MQIEVNSEPDADNHDGQRLLRDPRRRAADPPRGDDRRRVAHARRRHPARPAAARRRAGQPRGLVAGAQAHVRHQRLPAGRHRAGADRTDAPRIPRRAFSPCARSCASSSIRSGGCATARSSTTSRPTSPDADAATRVCRASACWRICRTRTCSAAPSPPASPAATSASARRPTCSPPTASFFGLPIRSSGFIFTSRQRLDVTETFSTIDQRVGVTAEQRWRPYPHVGSDLELPLRAGAHVRSGSRARRSAPDRHRREDLEGEPGDGVRPPRRSVEPDARLVLGRELEQAMPVLGSVSTQRQAAAAAGRSIRRPGRSSLAGPRATRHRIRREALIVSERFLLGGATTVRGYAEDSLGPRDVLGLPRRRRAAGVQRRAALSGARLGAGRGVCRCRQRLRDERRILVRAISPSATASACGWRRRSRCSASTSASRPERSHPTAPPISSAAAGSTSASGTFSEV